MDLSVADAAAIVSTALAVAGVVGTIFYAAVIKPLGTAIIDLRELINEIREDIKRDEEKRQKMEVRLAGIEQNLKAVNHRLDNLERGGMA